MRKKKPLLCIVLALLIPLVFAMPIFADMGPKPSVHIAFEGMGNKKYIIALLPTAKGYGPYSSDVKGNESAVDLIFRNLAAEEGLYYWGQAETLEGSDTYVWGYYPPEAFKIALYFPEQEVAVVSDKLYERYAFDSYFRVDGTGLFLAGQVVPGSTFAVKATYLYHREILGFVGRVLVTLVLELGLAYVLGFRQKKQRNLIILVNILTQIFLNIVLIVGGGDLTYWVFPIVYLFLEVLIFLLEAVIYSFKLIPESGKTIEKVHPAIYALLANALSAVGGLILGQYLYQLV